METTGASPTYTASPSRYLATPGATFPRTMPATIHRITHIYRSLSKKPSPLVSSLISVPADMKFLLNDNERTLRILKLPASADDFTSTVLPSNYPQDPVQLKYCLHIRPGTSFTLY